MKPDFTFCDGGLTYAVVTRPQPEYDADADAVRFVGYAYRPEIPPDHKGRMELFRVIWHPCDDWESRPERERCRWEEPYRIEQYSGYYSKTTGINFYRDY